MADHSLAHGLRYYLPLRRETKIYQRRKVVVDKPVFPGYLFARFDPEGRAKILQTNHVVRVLEVPDQERLLGEIRRGLKPAAPCLLVEPKVHVPRGRFEATVDLARGLGFEVLRGPKVSIL